jgi:3-deoxy-D-manno-octulosonate 8-phosphate phosphatase (KDO 8-P phosphatase)
MNILSQFRSIKLFVFDVDGVLTNGILLLLETGEMARTMNIKDGYALQLAVKKGYRVLVISGGESPAVERRLNKLGIRDVFMGITDKKEVLSRFAEKHGIKREELLYMGDDMPDFTAMKSAGLPCCPADAVPEIRGISSYISPVAGGQGCVRDVIEKVLKLNQHWDTDDSIASR